MSRGKRSRCRSDSIVLRYLLNDLLTDFRCESRIRYRNIQQYGEVLLIIFWQVVDEDRISTNQSDQGRIIEGRVVCARNTRSGKCGLGG